MKLVTCDRALENLYIQFTDGSAIKVSETFLHKQNIFMPTGPSLVDVELVLVLAGSDGYSRVLTSRAMHVSMQQELALYFQCEFL